MSTPLIAAITSIIPLSEAEEIYIESLCRPIVLHPGEYFLREGEVCRSIAFIEQGLCRYGINRDGDELTYFFSAEGEFMSNYPSFLNQTVSDRSIQAIEETHLQTIDFNQLQQFYSRVRSGERFGRLVIEQIFLQSLQQLTSIYTESPEQRYQRFIDSFGAIQQRIPQYIVASYVGIQPQSLSRIRARWAGRVYGHGSSPE